MKRKRSFLFAAVTAALFFGLQGVKAQELNTPDYESFKNNIGDSATVDGDVIKFSGNITADSEAGNLEGKSLTIDGSNYSFNGNSNKGFTINNGQTVTIQNIKTDGINGFTSDGNGGAINNSGNITLSDVIFSNNSAVKGGAIYNAANAEIGFNNVTFNAANGSRANDIYNAGTITASGINNINSAITNAGILNLDGTNTIKAALNSTNELNFTGTNVVENDITGSGTATNSGNLTLKSDASGFTGTFTQSDGSTTVDISGTFFGGTSTINGGTLTWRSGNDIDDNATLIISGENTVFNLGEGYSVPLLTINNGSSISSEVTTNLNLGTLEIAGGSVALNAGDTWSSSYVHLTDGTLDYSDLTQNGRLVASGGTLNVNSGKLNIANTSYIDKNVTTNIKTGSTVDIIAGGSVTLNTGDTWAGDIKLNGGTLTYSDLSANGKLTASSGALNVNSGKLNIAADSSIAGDVITKIKADSTVEVAGGSVELNTYDTWAGDINMTGGSLDYSDLTTNGKLTASGGALNVNSGKLNIANGSSIGSGVTTNIKTGSTVDIAGGSVALNTGDTWAGDINITGGTLDYSDLTTNGKLTASGGALNVNSGKLNIANGSSIGSGVTTNIKTGSTVDIAGGSVALNTGDTWAGDINITAGTLDYSDLTTNGKLTASGGALNINSGKLNIVADSSIASGANANIKAGSTVDIAGGSVELNTGDTWTGDINITAGTLDYSDLTTNGKLTASGGTLNVNSGKLNIAADSSIESGVRTNIKEGSTVEVADGSVALNAGDTWAGDINMTGGSLEYSNLTANGKITATGGTVNVNSGSLTLEGNSNISTGVTGIIASGANLVIKKNMAVAGNISGAGTLKNEGIALTLSGNNSGLENYVQTSGSATLGSGTMFKSTDLQGGSLTFNSNAAIGSGLINSTGSANKSLVINNNTSADAILDALTASGTNLQLTLNSSNSSKNIAVDGTNIKQLNLSGNQTLSGNLTGAGTISKGNGTLNLSGDNSGFSGTFTQTGGTTNVTGQISTGAKNINSGNFNITSDNLDYSNVNIGNNTKFTHTSTSTEGGIVDNQVTFKGSGATAKFTGTGNTAYVLTNKSASANNTVAFENSTVKLADTNYNGKYSLTNTIIDMTTETSADGNYTENYTINNLTGSNIGMNIDIDFVNNNGTVGIISDTITINSGNPKINLNAISIHNDQFAENGGANSYNTQVIKGSGSFGSSNVATGASTVYNYLVNLNGQNIVLNRGAFTDEHSLNILTSQTDGDRFFTFSGSGEETYHIGESLGTALEGKLVITGNGSDKSTISGVITDEKGVPTGDKGSLFNIQDNKLDLSISNVKITDASGTDGSVVNLNNADSTVTITNTVITGNTATGNGGALNIGENGGTVEISNSTLSNNTAGQNGGALNISSKGQANVSGTTFENNGATGNGGAIYNEGQLSLTNVTVKAANGANKNDIYNSGTAITSGTNTFNSDITSTDTFTFGGNSNTIAGAINNSGTMDFNGLTDTVTGTIVNSGTMNFTKTNILEGNITNAGSMVLGGSNTIKGILNSTNKLDFTGTNIVENDITGSGTASNSGTLTIKADASGFTGTFSQTEGSTTLNKGADFFGGTSTISGGTLNWFGNDLADTAKLTVSGDTTSLNLGNGTDSVILTIQNGGSIAQEVKTLINTDAELVIGGNGAGTVSLNAQGEGADSWLGKISLKDGGSLTVDGFEQNQNGTITAEGGTLNLATGNLTLGKGSSIADTVKTTISADTNLYVSGGNAVLSQDTDTWKGNIYLNGSKDSTLTINGFDNNGKIVTDGGTLNLNQGRLTLADGSEIAVNTVTNLAAGTGLDIIEGGTAGIDDEDSWLGDINLDGGTLNYGASKAQEGSLIASKGTLNVLSGAVLQIKIPSVIADEVGVDIQRGSRVEVEEGGSLNLDSETNDKWNGVIQIKDGSLKTTALSNNTSGGGGLQQTGGTSEFTQNSHIIINTSDSFINGGNILVTNNSSLTIGSQTQPVVADSLTLTENSLFSSMNNALENTTIGDMKINGDNGINIDISPRFHKSDKYFIDNITSDMVDGGVLKIDKFNFVNLCPIDRNIKLQIFNYDNIADNVTFADSEHSIFTPIGNYHLYSDGGGSYTARLMEYNPQVFRGQVSTLAMYNNQLAVDDVLLNHVSLQSERFLTQGQNANKYAITVPQFAPYQYKREEGGLWAKSFANFETLSLTHGLNVGNNAYGTIIGADFPVVHLKNGWKFMPTAFIGYNGSNQYFSHVDMYQNGGQGGFMGTFMKKDFIGSVLAYGGGYNNEMHVAGHTDSTGNWFAGTAAKLAYNLHPTKHFTIQPTAFVSYNAFGKQTWRTDFGIMSMNHGMLNGVNVAPGVNLIYARESWSTYATIQYMYNISEQVGGKAGNVALPNVKMRHGYLQYGIGVTKTWKDQLSSYFQITFRNGGRTGVGFQLGFQYLFDWFKPRKKMQTVENTNKVPVKTVIKKIN